MKGLATLRPADLRRRQKGGGGAAVPQGEFAPRQSGTEGKWAPAKRRSLVDSIVAEIAGRIASGELKDGDLLPCQNDLARTLGVSRTSLREALNKLAGMGLVQLRQGSGTFIRSDRTPNRGR